MGSRERGEGGTDAGDRDSGQPFGERPAAIEERGFDQRRGRSGGSRRLQMIVSVVTIPGDRDEESPVQRGPGVGADPVHFRIPVIVTTIPAAGTDRPTIDDVDDFDETSSNQRGASPRLRARAAAATSTSSKCRRSVPTIW